ncbi:GNAT family N-acetyltransferase [Microbacterium sp. KSW2-29]|uniref:GNAT family N-acetyltransferase n=1 Tax=Microbacterium phycohabitans TaxID=3075993 RepID=A0ABU3SJ40_9MICO|nr:GNAT family N-acetyltransferase [Microbacterium sp. KSW2-29]MDU0344806.1 GNAT family N-acetyltransferase [Microbacterium sp. KSW2-29]
MSDLLVRAATPGDSRCIATVHVQSWREARTEQVPAALVEQLDVELSEWRWAARLRGETPRGGERLGDTWVALADGHVIGFSSGGPTRDADRPRSEPELYALYVLASHYGTGAGAALLEAAIGTGAASLWVLSDNERAIAFYLKHGFAPDGAVRTDGRWGGSLTELRLTR